MTLTPQRPRLPGALGTGAALVGLFFAAYSTHDYAQHLDRQLHTTHCSFVPGLVEAAGGANACTAAMYSPYAAIFRGAYWGGVPISLFALGAYTFFVAFGVYLLAAGDAASKRAWQAFGVASVFPLAASLVMFAITLTRLTGFCKLCVGMYFASALLATAGLLAWHWAGGRRALGPRADETVRDPFVAASAGVVPPGYPPPAYGPPPDPADAYGAAPYAPPRGSAFVVPIALAVLGFFALMPALVYAASLPDVRPYLVSCGTLVEKTEAHGALVKLPTLHPKQPALLVVDPLCPTCKAFHERLVDEGVLENLDVSVAIFPLDSECNWMLDRPLHPGACVVAKAFLCGDKAGESRQILEWAYANQDELRDAGKAGKDFVRAKVKARFPGVDACIGEASTGRRLDNVLHFAIANKLTVSTPQLFLGERRVCDEDTDLGLRYTLTQLAPQVLQ